MMAAVGVALFALFVPCCCACAAHRKCARLTLVCVVEAGGVGRWFGGRCCEEAVTWEGVLYLGMDEAGMEECVLWRVVGLWCLVGVKCLLCVGYHHK